MSPALPYPKVAWKDGFAPSSKVWIYIADRALDASEAGRVQTALDAFCKQWTAHNQALSAAGEVFLHRVVLLMVDETLAGASGCSIDKSVHFLEGLGQSLGVDLFDRMQFGWADPTGEVHMDNRSTMEDHLKNGRIQPETPVLNALASTKEALQHNLWGPFSESWMRRLLTPNLPTTG
jgi:hypothetical protein